MKISIPGLVAKNTARGLRYYWTASPRLRKAKWKDMALGGDLDTAIAMAKARNAEVDAWADGGAKPRMVARFAAARTLDALIAAYKAERFRPAGEGGLAPATQKQYQSRFTLLSAWAGDKPLGYITRARVQTLLREALKPLPDGTVRAHMADETARVLRALLQWGVDHDWLAENPAVRPGIAKPRPRHQVWSLEAREAITAAATKAGQPSMVLAVDLAFMIGQREADLLRLSITQLAEIPHHKLDPDVAARIAGPDGRVLGIRLRQRKTNRWVEVPIVGATRERALAAVAEAKAAARMTLLVDDSRGAPWTLRSRRRRGDAEDSDAEAGQRRFIRTFADLRTTAEATAREFGNEPLADELAGLQFRDFRRTAVVYMGELGLADHLIAAVTGHSLDETKRILETYMPRTTGMAARAIAMSHARLPKPDAPGKSVGIPTRRSSE